MTVVSQHIHVPSTLRATATQPLPELADVIEGARPEGARLVSATPAGAHAPSGTYLVVWEVPTE